MLNNLLFYRLLITNGFAMAMLAYAYSLGYIHMVLARDVSGISEVIIGLFAIGLVSTFIRGYKVSEALNKVKQPQYKGLYMDAEARRKFLKMPAKNTHLLRISEYLVTLGLLGNCVGFFIALENAGGGDNQALANSLLAGMGTAFGATIVGTVAGLLMWINYSMIETATSVLIEDTK